MKMDIDEETARIDEFTRTGNYHAALNIALSAMNECHRNHDQHGVDHFIGVIKNIVNSLANEFGS